MNVLISPNAFKGSMTSLQAANAIRRGIDESGVATETTVVPVADGGDGSLTTILEIFSGSQREVRVSGPIQRKITASWGIINEGKTAFIETALIYGLALLADDERNPYVTTSRGIGEAILVGLDLGLRDFVISVGGSANNDAGTGMLKALGGKFLDDEGNELVDGGYALRDLHSIDLGGMDPRLKDSRFLILSDSSVPLVGPKGVSIMYSPGKGATQEMALELDASLRNFATVAEQVIGINYGEVPSSGSGGGVVSAGQYFLGGRVEYGIEYVLNRLDFDQYLNDVDLVVVGEGQLDEQTVYNKAPIGVAKRAHAKGVHVVSVSALLGDGYEEVFNHGINVVVSANPYGTIPDQAKQLTESGLSKLVCEAFAQLSEASMGLHNGKTIIWGRSQ